MTQKRALGKGLHSLIPSKPVPPPPPPAVEAGTQITELPIDQIHVNPNQPRKEFDVEPLEELARSIQANGVIQPLIVRKHGEHYELIAGERRLRAAALAGLTRVPVALKEVADDKVLEVAIIENIQREDLNPVELAVAFARMSQDLGLSHEEIGVRTGKDRATITNSLRLLQLPADLLSLLAGRKISAGHGRAILKLTSEDDQRQLAREVIERGLSVRDTERIAAAFSEPEKPKPEPAPVDPNVRAAIDELERALGTKVRIVERGTGRGRIEIEYYSQEELHRIYGIIGGNP